MNMKFFSAALLALTATTRLQAENLLRNASFELGDAEYGCVRYLDIDGKLEYRAPVTEKQDAVKGRCALRIDNPDNDGIHFFSHEFELRPEQPYTFSFWARTDRPGFPVRVMFLSTARTKEARVDWVGHETTVRPTATWQQYTLTMTPKPGHRFYQVDLRYGHDSGGATLFLDGFQVNPGLKAAEWVPFSAVEAAFRNTPQLRTDPALPTELMIVNYTGDPRRVTGTFSCRDDYRNTPVGAERKFSCDVPPESVATQEFAPGFSQFGTFRAEAAGDGWEALPFHYAVIAPPDPANRPTVRQIGLEAGFMDGNADISKKRRSFKAQAAGMAEYWNDRRLTGVTLLRVGNFGRPFLWPEMEKSPGVFDWAETDRLVVWAEQNRIDLMPVLGGAFIHYKDSAEAARMPDFLLNAQTLSDDGLALRNCFRVKPPLEDWIRYVRAVGTRYRGRIHCYEILNESNLYLKPADYHAYLKAAYETLKAIDPTVTVAGFSVTSDHGANYEFLDRCGALGSLRYLDAVTFHPYGARSDNTPVRAMDNNRSLRELADRHRPGVPLWNSELYYLHGTTNDTVEATRATAHQFIRRWLIDAGCGIEQSILVPDYYLYRDDRHPNWAGSRHYLTRRNVPSDLLVAHNAMARFFAGARPAGELQLRNGALGYRFTAMDGTMLAAIWRPEEAPATELEIPAGSEMLEAFDLFGNPLPVEAGVMRFKLGPDPLYFRGPGIGSRLTAARSIAGCTYTVGGAGWLVDRGRLALGVEMRNLSDQPLTLQVRPTALPDKVNAGKSREVRLAPDKAEVLIFPLKDQTRRQLPGGKFKLRVVSGQQTSQEECELAPVELCRPGVPVRVDTAGKMRGGSDQWQGAADLAFTFTVTAAPEAFRVAIKVADDRRGNRAAAPWNNDSIEIFVDPTPADAIGTSAWTPRVGRVYLLPAASGLPAASECSGSIAPGSVTWSIDDLPGGGYTATAAIGWDTLGLKGPAPIAFDVVVNDSDGDSRKSHMNWSGSARNHADRSRFGLLLPEP